MTKFALRTVLLASLAAGLTACGGPPSSPTAQVPTSTVTVVPYTTRPAPSEEPDSEPGGCNRDFVVSGLRPLVPYAQFSLSHNSIYGVHTLNVWLVDPELDPSASADDVAGGTALALRHAASLSHTMMLADPCVSTAFTGITYIVVDREYNEWYTGQVDPASVPTMDDLTDNQLDTLMQAFEAGFARTEQPPSAAGQTSPVGSCTWPEAQTRLQGLFSPDRLNVTFYFVKDDDGANVWAQWDGLPDLEVFLPTVIDIAAQLPCLYPLDTLWVVYVDAEGDTQIVLAAPGDAVRSGDPATLVEYLEYVYPR